MTVEGAVDRRPPPTVEATAYYVVAEALTNTVKHAAASQATVHLCGRGTRLEIEVADDGAGGAAPEGPGLQGLADRVEALGGRLDIDSPPGAGTTIRAGLPLVPGPPGTQGAP